MANSDDLECFISLDRDVQLWKIFEALGGGGGDTVTVTNPFALDATAQSILTTENAINAKLPTLGQKAMVGSLPVVIASDQSAIAVTTASLPLPAGAATEATLAKLPLSQGSTTSGQSGELMQGAVTTAAPTYTTAQTSPLSLTTGGALRVSSTGNGVSDAIARATVTSGTTTIAEGHKCITIFTSNDWVGTVAGVTFPPNATETYPAPGGDTLGSLAIVWTAGTLYYSTIG